MPLLLPIRPVCCVTYPPGSHTTLTLPHKGGGDLSHRNNLYFPHKGRRDSHSWRKYFSLTLSMGRGLAVPLNNFSLPLDGGGSEWG